MREKGGQIKLLNQFQKELNYWNLVSTVANNYMWLQD
jgi:hypothetical protein